ncbi:hypothetical protein K788_0009171 [Paraburkholderia caribensis MBA4]|uniref:Uncharacterized protein n=1 Tax=Paraburkholderia caribensis MBA4 TaxID=1323664 RepID=A0A0P0R9B3_9BURK|nr:hypothetical protein K788_0009130 [Paraburkholderia caribensis MBA4]ALL67013.1 hypothetical protein K788_0009171 [Paraburkholderia caribensis MBA4]
MWALDGKRVVIFGSPIAKVIESHTEVIEEGSSNRIIRQ